jgi:hypothetical protein
MKFSQVLITFIILAFSAASQAAETGYIVYHNTQHPDYVQLCINMSPVGNNGTDQDVHACISSKSSQPLAFNSPTTIHPLMVFFRTANYGAILINDWPIACYKLHPPQVATLTVINAKGSYRITC